MWRGLQHPQVTHQSHRQRQQALRQRQLLLLSQQYTRNPPCTQLLPRTLQLRPTQQPIRQAIPQPPAIPQSLQATAILQPLTPMPWHNQSHMHQQPKPQHMRIRSAMEQQQPELHICSLCMGQQQQAISNLLHRPTLQRYSRRRPRIPRARRLQHLTNKLVNQPLLLTRSKLLGCKQYIYTNITYYIYERRLF